MGLFDEIERNIKAAIDEAKQAQQGKREPPAAPATPKPTREKSAERDERQADQQQQWEPEPEAPRHLEPVVQHHSPAARHYEEDGTLARESLREARTRQEKANSLKKDQLDKQTESFKDRFSHQSPKRMLRQILSSKNGLAAAYLAQEILGPPKAMRKRK